jgi:hypothetical protein
MGSTDQSAARGSPPSLEWQLRVLLTGLVLARGVAELCIMPPFEDWDEYQHVAYVVHVGETGRRATLGETDVPRSLLSAMLPAFPQPRSALEQMDPRLGAVGYATYWSRHASKPMAGESVTVPVEGMERANQIKIYQDRHSLWYYRLAAPLFGAMGGVHDLRCSVGGLRLVNLLIMVGAVWVALAVVAGRVRSRRVAAWVGLAIAVHPVFLMTGARVSNDAPGIFVATVVVAGAMGLDERRLTWKCAVLGLLTGSAILIKATHWSLVPFLAGCWFFTVIRHRVPAGRALGSGLAMGMGLLVVAGPEVGHNLVAYGVPTPMQEAVLNRQHGRNLADLFHTAGTLSWIKEAERLWLSQTFVAGGWSFVGSGLKVRAVYFDAALAGLLGWVWWPVGRADRRLGGPLGRWFRLSRRRLDGPASAFESIGTPMACLLLCLSVTAALDYHAVQSKLAWGQSTTGPWYAAAALPWFLTLTIAGALAWPSRRLGTTLAAVLVGSCLIGEQTMLWTRMLPTYSGGASGWEALRRIAELQPSFLGTATCLITLAAGSLLLIATGIAIARLPNLEREHETTDRVPGPRGWRAVHRADRPALAIRAGFGIDSFCIWKFLGSLSVARIGSFAGTSGECESRNAGPSDHATVSSPLGFSASSPW